MAERGPPRPVGDGEQEFTFRKVQLFKNEHLGKGGYGTVCKAKCDQLICAAKLLYSELVPLLPPTSGKVHRQPPNRFEEECRFLSRINHPNIVQYLGTYRDPETNAPVLLMELMDESLTHFLESSPGDIPYHIQVILSQDIAQALAFLHANKIIHRDLSSNNVLLIAGVRAKISDLGMSRFRDMSKTRSSTRTACPGTPAFMSPEALNEPPVYTEKLDIFSFGVLLVQIVTRVFPDPANRFEIQHIPDRRNPTRMIEARILIPEVERRQAQISLITPTHPLLPIALKCLKDEAVERPSSQQLCQSTDALKGTVEYKESSQVVEGQHETNDLQLDSAIPFQGNETEFIQLLQQEVRSKEHQLRKLNAELESLRQTLTQRDRQVADLSEQLSGRHSERLSQAEDSFESLAPACEEIVKLSWEALPYEFVQKSGHSCTVLNDKVYFRSGERALHEFCFTSYRTRKFPLNYFVPTRYTLVDVGGLLTTVGGVTPADWPLSAKMSDMVLSWSNSKWVEKYPSMPTSRWACSAVYANSALIVAGGATDTKLNKPIKTVEVLNTISQQWSSVSSLPFATAQPSISLCGEHIYLLPGSTTSEEMHSVLKCPFSGLIQSNPTSGAWEKIATLPIHSSTLVTVKGHLLVVGGKSSDGEYSKDIRQYDPRIDSWKVISEMRLAHSGCMAALLPDNRLVVLGGSSSKPMYELAAIID